MADAEARAEFCEEGMGREPAPHEMDGDVDYVMEHPETGQTIAGVCHARGRNAGLPSQWLLYVAVTDLEACLEAVRDLGGMVLSEQQPEGGHAQAVIEDPGGAVLALFEVETA